MVWDILNAPSFPDRDLSSLTNLGGGGAAAPPELLRRMRAQLPGRGAVTGYGLTETSSMSRRIAGATTTSTRTAWACPFRCATCAS